MCDSLSTNSYDSTIKPAKRLKINVLEPDSESDFETEWIDSDITPTLQYYLNILGIPIGLSDALSTVIVLVPH